MLRRLLFLPALLVTLALAACETPDKGAPESVPAPARYQACQDDSDCVLVENSCNGCCQRDAVSRKDSAAFLAEVARVCEGYDGAVCDCCYHPAQAVCEAGRCGVKALGDRCE